jgi:single-strand DNA-binding protein
MSGDGGDREERVDFHNIVSWAKLAEICGQLLHKGDKVYVEGRIQTRDWKGQDGQDRRITEIVIDQMMLLYSPSGRSSTSGDDAGYPADDQSSAPASAPAQTDEPVSDQVDEVEDVSDDIPF